MVGKSYYFSKNHSFHGDFSPCATDNKGRFSAKIEYSPYNGLILDFCISDSETPFTCDRLYGVLNTGEICTLIGPFDFSQSTMHFGKLRILTGHHPFLVMIFGGFFTETDLLSHCNFSLNGMQEFIHPQGFITQLKHSTKPLLSTQGKDWKIEVINSTSFSMIGDGLVNIIDCHNKLALERFREEFKNIKNSFPDAFFLLRKELKFYFKYAHSTMHDVIGNIKELWKISALFSIILDKPILPDDLMLKFEGQNTSHSCLFSNSVEQRTIDLALTTISHHTLPLNWKQIDVGTILNNWFKISNNYESLSVIYQNETGYRTLPQAHADIILYATQLESIHNSLPEKSNEKYLRPIKKYASPELMKKLEDSFSEFNTKSLGENIATLRNELAHVGRPKVLMAKMKIQDYISIGLYLKIIVTSHLLFNLGLNTEQIHKYQNRVAY